MKAHQPTTNHPFLLGLLLIALAGVWVSFALTKGFENQPQQILLAIILTVLAAITFLNSHSKHKSHILFTIYFIVGLLYSALVWTQENYSLILSVVALTSAIGFFVSIFGGKDSMTMKHEQMRKHATINKSSVSQAKKVRTTRQNASRKKPAKKTVRRTKKVVRRTITRKKAPARRNVAKRTVRRTTSRRRR